MSAEAYKYQIAVENMNKAEELAIDEHQSFYVCSLIIKFNFLFLIC